MILESVTVASFRVAARQSSTATKYRLPLNDSALTYQNYAQHRPTEVSVGIFDLRADRFRSDFARLFDRDVYCLETAGLVSDSSQPSLQPPPARRIRDQQTNATGENPLLFEPVDTVYHRHRTNTGDADVGFFHYIDQT